MPIEFLIFYMFEAQKADIIGALAIFTNAFCYMFSNKSKVFQVRPAWMNVRQGPTRLKRHLFYRFKACGDRNPVATSETLINKEGAGL